MEVVINLSSVGVLALSGEDLCSTMAVGAEKEDEAGLIHESNKLVNFDQENTDINLNQVSGLKMVTISSDQFLVKSNINLDIMAHVRSKSHKCHR